MTIQQSSKIRGSYRTEITAVPSVAQTADVQNIVFGGLASNTINSKPIAVYWHNQTPGGNTGPQPTTGVGGYPAANPNPGSFYFIIPTLGDTIQGLGHSELWIFTGVVTPSSNGWVQVLSQNNIGSTAQAGSDGGAGGSGGGDGGGGE